MLAKSRTEFDRRLQETPGYDWNLLAHVVNSADAIGTPWQNSARDFLQHIVARWPSDTPAARVARVAAISLLARMKGDDSGSGNLYFEEPTPGAMLAAFDKLVEATPFIRFGHRASNDAILQATEDRAEICLIDVGMGSGSQWFDLLDRLAQRSRPPRLRLIGIDVPLSADEPTRALEAAGAALSQYAQERGVSFSFQAIASPVQDVDFASIERRPGEALAVNAAFALHHIPTSDEHTGIVDSRTAVLRRIRALRPDVFTMVEPDSDHNSLSLKLLVREAIAHYLTVFDALATLLPGNAAERQTLEEAFFGREILNILSHDGVQRVERHERHRNWCQRMHHEGFRPLAPVAKGARSPVGRREAETCQPSPISVRHCKGGQLLCWKSRPLVAATAWTA